MKVTIEELKHDYPHLNFTEQKDGYIEVRVKSVSWYIRPDNLTKDAQRELEREEDRAVAIIEFMQKYPHLYPWMTQMPAGEYVPTSAWVLRNGRDGEACGISNIHGLTDIQLDYLEEEATKAVRDGWFYCTGCMTAYPKDQYAYFHFAGSYCKSCETKDPAAARRAREETYD